MKELDSTWRKILAVVVLAVGMVVIWGVVAGWLGSLVEDFARGVRIYENLEVAADGTPVISAGAHTAGTSADLSRRTLDGKPWPNDFETWLYPAYLQGPGRVAGLVNYPMSWEEYGGRVLGMTDSKRRPPIGTPCAIPAPNGHFYFAGFDAFSRMPLGYLGAQGFRESRPDGAQQFSLPGNNRPLTAVITTSGMTEGNRIFQFHGGGVAEDSLDPWLVFVVDGQSFWQIDLRARTAETIAKLDGAFSVSHLRTLASTVAGAVHSQAGDKPATSRTHLVATRVITWKFVSAGGADSFVAAGGAPERPKTAQVLVAWANDRLTLFDPPAHEQWEFKLPEEVSGEQLIVYWTQPEELLLSMHDGYWEEGPVSKLLWIKPDGSVTRRERVALRGWLPPSPKRTAWNFAGVAPVPIAWIIGILGAAPLSLVQHNMAASYLDALQQTWQVAWLPLVVVLAVSLPAAWCVRRWQRQYRRPNTAVWSTLIFLLGPLGLAAYWLEHRRAKLETCRECGHVVPRDRDTCADCRTPFPAPPLVGTEIFA